MPGKGSFHYVKELKSGWAVSENVVDDDDAMLRVLGSCSVGPASFTVKCRWQSLEMSLLSPWSRVGSGVGAAGVTERHILLKSVEVWKCGKCGLWFKGEKDGNVRRSMWDFMLKCLDLF